MPGNSGTPDSRRISRLLRISSRTVRPRYGASAQRLFFSSPMVRGSIIYDIAREAGSERCRSGTYRHDTLERWMIREFEAAPRLPLPRFILTKLERDILSRRASAQQRRLGPQLMHRRPSLRK